MKNTAQYCGNPMMQWEEKKRGCEIGEGMFVVWKKVKFVSLFHCILSCGTNLLQMMLSEINTNLYK